MAHTTNSKNLSVLSWLPILIFPLICFLEAKKSSAMNDIDSCWRNDPNWDSNRQALAECAKGFGSDAEGGKKGGIYVVNDPSDDDKNPKPGTLRYGAIQPGPLWIVFDRDMTIKFLNELLVSSYKTIDGRGFKVEIGHGPCIGLKHVTNVIIHGISIHDCVPGPPGELVRCGPNEFCELDHDVDGDGIRLFEAAHVWIDHCYFEKCADGLLDIIHESNYATVSNNFFTKHDKVMCFGHDDSESADKDMKITVAFNHFGPELVQRMPRVRLGYCHVTNNYYEKWMKYAVGGSANPTIFSQANYFYAPDDPTKKEATKRDIDGDPRIWQNWTWKSTDDVFENGAFFVESGKGDASPNYSKDQSFTIGAGSDVADLTADAGPLHCVPGQPCT